LRFAGKGGYRIRIQVDRSRRSVLGLGELNCPAVEMNLRPRARVLFGETHPGVDADHKLRQMSREPFGDHLVQTVRLLVAEKPQAPRDFFPLADQSGRIDCDLCGESML
jgi:hypothetical protein